jgi:hypothetical protein
MGVWADSVAQWRFALLVYRCCELQKGDVVLRNISSRS